MWHSTSSRDAGPKRAARLVQPRTGRVLVEALEMPRTVFGRGVGLMLRRRLAEGGGMWIAPCNGVHMLGMRFPIDAVFLDRRLRVVRIVHRLRPWRMVPLVWRAHSVVELPAGRAARAELEVGEQLAVERE